MELGSIVGITGWGGIIALGLWLIMTGRLLPASVVDRMMDQAAREAKLWQDATEKAERAREIERETFDKAIESTRAVARIVDEFTAVSRKDHPHGS